MAEAGKILSIEDALRPLGVRIDSLPMPGCAR
jgi:hypothetical protein